MYYVGEKKLKKFSEWGKYAHCNEILRTARGRKNGVRRLETFYLRVYLNKYAKKMHRAILSYPRMSSPCGLISDCGSVRTSDTRSNDHGNIRILPIRVSPIV